jgi:hypothetical protein
VLGKEDSIAGALQKLDEWGAETFIPRTRLSVAVVVKSDITETATAATFAKYLQQ